jgi:CheY-like chemotaxis protein
MDDAQPTVLLVEDNDLVRDAVTGMLAAHGFPVVAAETAEQGILEFESNPAVSLAILDMMLPGKSGLDLAAELERRRPGFRILYMSGLGDSIAMESIARRAPDMVLIKPFNEEMLLQRVATLLGNNAADVESDEPLSAMPQSAFPWERLVEASDELGNAGASLMSYRDTAAGFAIAITHVAVLRVAQVPYTFRFTGNMALPLVLNVLPDDREEALRLIQQIGLGADIAPAA